MSSQLNQNADEKRQLSALTRVLLIEDNLIDAKVLKAMMGKCHHYEFDITHVESLTEALAHIESRSVDIVVSDLGLPDSAGTETVTKLRECQKQIPILVLTGADAQGIDVNVLRMGAQDYLVKGTFDVAGFERSVRYAIERSKAATEHQQTFSELLKANERYENTVAELGRVNEILRQEIAERSAVEQTLRKANVQFEQLFDNAADGISVIDTNYTVCRINDKEPIDWDGDKDELLGLPCHKVFQFSICGTDACVMRRILAGESKVETDVVGTCNGKDKAMILAATPLKDSSGEVFAIIEVLKDISERKALESQLLQAQKLESIGQLAAGIAHEINTPTQYVSDNTYFLKRAFEGLLDVVTQFKTVMDEASSCALSEERIGEVESVLKKAKLDYLTKHVPRALDQSLEGLDRIATIVAAMKEFSHPSDGVKVLVDLHQAIHNTCTVARNEWKYVADIVTEFDPNLPQVPCLRDELNQVILNLIVNAAHAISDVVDGGRGGKGVITLTTKLEEDWVEFSIRDTGCGMPDHILDRIFDPFFTTKEVGKGTGQGLSIVHSVVVDKHDGQITVDSQVGEGTAFTVRLPLKPSAGAQG